MHEFSIATQILESVLEFAQERQAMEVLKVRLEIGELMAVEAEQLQFCYDSIKQGTALENSSLEILFVSAVVRCPHCSYEGPPKYWDGARAGASVATLQCPRCSQAAKAIAGHDCAIKSIQAAKIHHERDPFSTAIASEV